MKVKKRGKPISMLATIKQKNTKKNVASQIEQKYNILSEQYAYGTA